MTESDVVEGDAASTFYMDAVPISSRGHITGRSENNRIVCAPGGCKGPVFFNKDLGTGLGVVQVRIIGLGKKADFGPCSDGQGHISRDGHVATHGN